MSDDIDKIRKELEEVRALKEKLRDEVEEMRREREHLASVRKPFSHGHARPIQPVPPEPPPPASIDLGGLTESLEDMMEGLGEQISDSIRHLEGIEAKIHLPRVRFRTKGGRRRTIEDIPPERIARVIGPLGSEERLKILDYLKDGGRTFNEIEEHIGRTGSSLTHHLNPLLEAGYVVKGEVRGKYFVTVEGRLAYRLSQWLTSRLETEREHNGEMSGHAEPSEEARVTIDFESDESDERSNTDLGNDAEASHGDSDGGGEQ
jgi:DNA-binding transcriptional ArsR family regulator